MKSRTKQTQPLMPDMTQVEGETEVEKKFLNSKEIDWEKEVLVQFTEGYCQCLYHFGGGIVFAGLAGVAQSSFKVIDVKTRMTLITTTFIGSEERVELNGTCIFLNFLM